MSGRFQIDLLHPGRVAHTWQEWFLGPVGPRRLLLASLAGAVLLALLLVALVLPARWGLSADLAAIPGLQREFQARQADLGTLRTNLRALSEEARRQVRWSELLAAMSEQIPATLRLQSVEAVRPAAPAGAAGPARAEYTIRIDAVTPLRPGSPPLVDFAQFMAGLMRDPAVSKRFTLRGWEIRPPASGAEEPLLSISVVLAEKAS